MSTEHIKVDALVIGGGIAGMQTALDLGDQGYQVALVERKSSIGGKMIDLSKVFPTLDCCSCICTPRMAEAEHHPNITTFTYAEVQRVRREEIAHQQIRGERQGLQPFGRRGHTVERAFVPEQPEAGEARDPQQPGKRNAGQPG